MHVVALEGPWTVKRPDFATVAVAAVRCNVAVEERIDRPVD